MRAPLSVIVPTLDAAAHLPGCLAALYEGLEAGLIRELIVVDGGSTDATLEIADEAGANLLTSVPSRGGQLIKGAEAASGDWFLFLHADSQLASGWSQEAGKHMRAQDMAAYFRLAFEQGGVAGRMVARWANLRARLWGLPYGDQALLISRNRYQVCGGYPLIPLMEDVAIARKLRGQLIPLETEAVTSAARYKTQGWVRRGGRNLWTLAQYFCGVSPERLSNSYSANERPKP